MRDLKIRAAQPADDVALEAIAHQGRLHLRAADERQRSHARLMVAEAQLGQQTQPVGFVLSWMIADEAEIVDIAVAEKARAQGVGAALLKQELLSLFEGGAASVFLEVRVGNQGARALYESQGFVEVGQRQAYYSDGEDAVLYRCLRPHP